MVSPLSLPQTELPPVCLAAPTFFGDQEDASDSTCLLLALYLSMLIGSYALEIYVIHRQEMKMIKFNDLQADYEAQSDEFKHIFTWEKVVDSTNYNQDILGVRKAKSLFGLVFDVVFYGSGLPAVVWHSILSTAAGLGFCDGGNSSNFELLLVSIFAFTLLMLETIIFSPFDYFLTISVKRKWNYSKANVASWAKNRLTNPIMTFFTKYLPVILIACKMTEISWSDGYLVPTILLATIIVDAGILFLHPLYIKPRFFKTIVQFDTDDDSRVLHQKIIDLAEENGYKNASERILLTESRSGDLHSNASVNMRNIVLNKELLRHHRGHDEEILAILKHELGHWKHMDMFRIYALDNLYMVVFAFFLQVAINNHTLLRTFGFYQESYCVSLFLFFKIWSVSFDYVLQKGFLWHTRMIEHKADLECVESGKTVDLHNALLRNFTANLECPFVDEIFVLVTKSHPTLLQRLQKLQEADDHLVEQPENQAENALTKKIQAVVAERPAE